MDFINILLLNKDKHILFGMVTFSLIAVSGVNVLQQSQFFSTTGESLGLCILFLSNIVTVV